MSGMTLAIKRVARSKIEEKTKPREEMVRDEKE